MTTPARPATATATRATQDRASPPSSLRVETPLLEATLTMSSHQPSDRDAVAAGDRTGRARDRRWRWRLPPVPARALGYAAAAWCLGFAGVSAWQVAADLTGPPDPRQRYAAYASGLAILGVLVLVLKLAGAAVALAAVLVPPGGWVAGRGSCSGWRCGGPLGC
jgi:hypothetical protein